MAALGVPCFVWAFSSYDKWGLLFIVGCKLLIMVASYCGASRLLDFTSCGLQALELGVVMARRLSCSAACGIFWTRDWTHAPCTGRRIPIHYATRCSHGIKVFYSYSNFFFPWPHWLACRILFPRPGIEPGLPAMEVGSLTTELPGNREFPIHSISMIWQSCQRNKDLFGLSC